MRDAKVSSVALPSEAVGSGEARRVCVHILRSPRRRAGPGAHDNRGRGLREKRNRGLAGGDQGVTGP